jgi:type III pantothenate kinase
MFKNSEVSTERIDWSDAWLALNIGNSRLHWAWFNGSTVKQTWDSPHLSPQAIATLIAYQLDFNACLAALPEAVPMPIPAQLPLWIASVVPSQTLLWQAYSLAQVLTLAHVPLQNLYATLGIDRALALWGAAKTLGLPVLVVDAGTGLTLTGADAAGRLVGGAILPGLGLQLRSLAQQTAALPQVNLPLSLPARWAQNTADAIASGVVYTLLAGLHDFVEAWQQTVGEGAIVFTGGDSAMLYGYFQQRFPETAAVMLRDPNLVFWGIRAIVEEERVRITDGE